MPYDRSYVEPDKFFTHKGVDIYYLYDNDDIDEPYLDEYAIGEYYDSSDDVDDQFVITMHDACKILKIPHVGHLNMKDMITELIDLGYITEDGFDPDWEPEPPIEIDTQTIPLPFEEFKDK